MGADGSLAALGSANVPADIARLAVQYNSNKRLDTKNKVNEEVQPDEAILFTITGKERATRLLRSAGQRAPALLAMTKQRDGEKHG